LNTTRVGQKNWNWRTSELIAARLRALISLLLFSPINVALSGFSVAYISFLLSGVNPNACLISAFLITFSVYNLNLLTDKKEDSLNFPEREKYYISEDKKLIFISISFYTLALFIGGFVNPLSIFALSIPLLLGIFYSVRINGFRFKDYFIGKNATVSLSWAMEASLLPAAFSFNSSVIAMIFLFIFIKGMINTILFDIRDVEGDIRAGVRTIPSILGVKNTRNLLFAMNTLLITWVLFAFYNSMFILYIPVFVFCIIYGYFYIIYFSRKREIPRTHYGVFIDGEWIFLLMLFLLTGFF